VGTVVLSIEVMKPDTKKEVDLEQSFYAPSFLPSEPKWDTGARDNREPR